MTYQNIYTHRKVLTLNICYKGKSKTSLIPSEKTRKSKLIPMEIEGRRIIKISSEINEIESRHTTKKNKLFFRGD